jgi:hypothetical protein
MVPLPPLASRAFTSTWVRTWSKRWGTVRMGGSDPTAFSRRTSPGTLKAARFQARSSSSARSISSNSSFRSVAKTCREATMLWSRSAPSESSPATSRISSRAPWTSARASGRSARGTRIARSASSRREWIAAAPALMKERGLLISWARPATIVPTAASFSAWTSAAWASRRVRLARSSSRLRSARARLARRSRTSDAARAKSSRGRIGLNR